MTFYRGTAATLTFLTALLPFAGSVIAQQQAQQTQFDVQQEEADAETNGGVRYILRLDQSLIATDNNAFARRSPGIVSRSTTRATAGISSETRSTNIELTGTYALRGVRNFNGDINFDFADPSFRLSYGWQGPGTRFNSFMTYSRNDLRFINPLELLDENDEIDFSDPLIAFDSGTGTRNNLRYGGNLALRTDRPFGVRFNALVTDLSFDDATTTFFFDTKEVTLGAEARFDISPTTRATLGYERYELSSELGGNAQTDTVDLDVTFSRPTSQLGFGLSQARTDVGDRREARIFQSYQLANEALISATIGLTQAAESGETFTTGSLSYSQALPFATLSASGARNFSTNTDGDEQLTTSLNLSAVRELSPIAVVGVQAVYSDTEETASDEASTFTSLGATLNYNFTRDWAMEAGLEIQSRDSFDEDDGTVDGTRTELSVTFSRDFSFLR